MLKFDHSKTFCITKYSKKNDIRDISFELQNLIHPQFLLLFNIFSNQTTENKEVWK